MTGSILVVDDMPEMQRMLSCALTSEGHRVATAGSGEEALARIEAQEFDLIVTDIVMPDLDGLEVLEKSQLLNPRTAVMVMTAYANLETAVTALRRGACDYLEKPLNLDDLNLRVRRALECREAIWRASLQRRALLRTSAVDTFVGESPAMRILLEQIARGARLSSHVLITGERGVGKGLVARALHGASPRRDRAFMAVSCGTISASLLESELFGHPRRPATTKAETSAGLLAAASGGTLLLDEIADLPLSLQGKLLRVMDEKRVWPEGTLTPVPADVRIFASTCHDLAKEVAAGRFREDLFYRLNVVHLKVPPLRERRRDIPLLVEELIEKLNAKLGTRFLGIHRDALVALMARSWRGNVRELEDTLERAMAFRGGDLVSLPQGLAEATAGEEPRSPNLRDALRRFEREHLMSVIAETHADKRAAARLLGISLASLYRKLNAATDEGPAPAQGA